MNHPVRVLLLGGTTESRLLAERLRTDPRVAVTTSLAGRTLHHPPPPGPFRVGGFGGVTGLIDFLERAAIDLVIDATHPFAAKISRNATLACAERGLPRLQFRRPPWPAQAGDRWLRVGDFTLAAATLPEMARRVFLAVGRQELAAFSGLPNIHFLVRMVEPPTLPLPLPHHEVILARGPFALTDEQDLLARHQIDAVVSKNSGGEPTYAKIAAARALGLPVVLIDPPPPEPGAHAPTLEQALAWLETHLTGAAA